MAASNKSKIAINNEIVLMRKAVRQSRVVVVRKLIKEAKLLQARKHGDEKVQEKCKRKAQRLLAEITAIKKLKDDEITKFGITNTCKLQDVLSDMSAEPATRVMTRVAFHKILSDRIAKFKDKFPDYEQHLGPGRKKLSKIERQVKREARNALRKSEIPGEANTAISHETEQLQDRIGDDNVNEESEESSDEEDENNDDSEKEIEPVVDNNIEEDVVDELDDSIAAKHGLEPGSILRIQTPKSTTKKRKINEDPSEIEAVDSLSEPSEEEKTPESKTPMEITSSTAEPSEKPKREKRKSASKTPIEISNLATEPSEKLKAKLKKNKEAKEIDTKVSVVPKKPKLIKVISKEATVRRFTDLMDDKETEECIQEAEISTTSKKRDVKIEKEVDSFFMTENGESEYLSVVVPKAKLAEDFDEEDDRFSQNHAAKRQKNFHERNNKFFSKIDQRANGGYGDKFGGRQRQNDSCNGRGPPEKFGRNSNGPARPPRNNKPEFEKKNEPKDEELHPSWAARKKQQEILKQGFQGKKIIFGD